MESASNRNKFRVSIDELSRELLNIGQKPRHIASGDNPMSLRHGQAVCDL